MKLYLGKCDYNGSGRKNCKAFITWEFADGKFSMCAEIWNPRETDCYTCGQCVDTVAGYFKGNKKAARMVAIWRDWHLNDMCAGSAVQEAFLKANPINAVYPESHYTVALAKLQAAGLSPDADGYVYGSAWKRQEIPADIAAEINSWSAADQIAV